jgi:Fe-S cluster assembly ATP-binding protein
MNVLSLKNFSVEVEGEVRSKVLEMSVEAGEICALVGKNGSGKSSLLSGIVTLPGYTSIGECICLGSNTEETTLDEKARAGVIYIGQKQPEIEGLSLIQLLYGMYKRTTEQPVSIIEYKDVLTEKLQKYSLKTELLLRPIGVGLSGGEKKQAELITLVASRPKLALIDEIDSGVDIDTLDNIAMVIRDLQEQGASILIVSHNFELIQKINPAKIYLAKEGNVGYFGTQIDLAALKENGFVSE